MTSRTTAGAIVLLILVGVVLWSLRARGIAQEASSASSTPDTCAMFDHEHAAWTGLLSQYVQNGVVDYAGIEHGGQASLNTYLHAIASVCGAHYATWSRQQKLAYWINAYNAYTVRLILDNYPLKSIRSIGLLPGAAFRKELIPSGVRGRTISLDVIEHQILRKELQEARIHFAIVCASKSCPTLRSEAYRARDVEQQLDDAARAFVRDESKNRFDAGAHTLYLSSIFKWFRADFERAAHTLPEFVARYADDATATALRSENVRLEFLDYDWSLNGR